MQKLGQRKVKNLFPLKLLFSTLRSWMWYGGHCKGTGGEEGGEWKMRPWEGREASHSCTEALPHVLPEKSEPSLLTEEQVLRVQQGPCRARVRGRPN